MLSIILQHVRELAEAHVSDAESGRYKLLTPFPPHAPDFPDFDAEALQFTDVPTDGPSASLDTIRAYDFFQRTDQLYYDYSYGIRSEDYRLSDVCHRYFLNGGLTGGDASFEALHAQFEDSFLRRYKRTTAGDLGHSDFRYTSLTPVAWSPDRVVIGEAEAGRLRDKAIGVYTDIDGGDAIVTALLDELRASSVAKLEYEVGFFDVVRHWIDPALFHHPGWAFEGGDRTLYGAGDPYFSENSVSLCFAQRFYLIRNMSATAKPASLPVAPTVAPPVRVEVRDHTRGATVRDHRRSTRSALLRNVAARMRTGPGNAPRVVMSPGSASPVSATASTAIPAPRAGYEWIPATADVPGHWQRARARQTPPAPVIPPPKPTFKIAAVKCRVLPQKA